MFYIIHCTTTTNHIASLSFANIGIKIFLNNTYSCHILNKVLINKALNTKIFYRAIEYFLSDWCIAKNCVSPHFYHRL